MCRTSTASLWRSYGRKTCAANKVQMAIVEGKSIFTDGWYDDFALAVDVPGLGLSPTSAFADEDWE
jgi:hypothetical protein